MLMAALSALATAISVYSFNSARHQFTVINDTKVPALVNAGTLAVKSNEITIASSELIGANTEEERQQAFSVLSSNVATLASSVRKSSTSNNSNEFTNLQAAVDDFEAQLKGLDELTQKNLEKNSTSARMIEELFNINYKLTSKLTPLVDQAYNNLKTTGASATEEGSNIINKLVNEDIENFRALLAIRSDVGSIGGWIGTFLMATDPDSEKGYKTEMAKSAFQIEIKASQLKDGNLITQELHDQLVALAKYEAEARNLKKSPTFFRDGLSTSDFIKNVIATQIDVDRAVVQNVDIVFSETALSTQKVAYNNKKIIDDLINIQVSKVRNALDAISTARQYTALVVQGALSTDKGIVSTVEQSTAFIYRKLEGLLDKVGTPEIKESLDVLKQLTRGQDGLIVRRLQQINNNKNIADTITVVQNDTVKINTIISSILDKEQSIISNSSALLNAELKQNGFFIITLGVIAIIASVLIGYFIINMGVIKPLSQLITSTRQLAEGDLENDIHYTNRTDELGELANALLIFRNNANEKIAIEAQAQKNKKNVEKEREENEQIKAAEAAEIQFAVEKLGSGLKKLSDGNLTFRMNDNFVGNLDAVRKDFNQSLETLQKALLRVSLNTKDISGNSSELREAATMLSSRTESQASSIEETANTISRITEQVRTTSQKALEASKVVQDTNTSANQASDIVKNAIKAIVRIEETSGEISNIISMIDEIAFQTNLLALNAGVEAARAGEAGKGFAVVAQEVRELAGRTTEAAKDIKSLISTSVEEVENGVKLVRGTGESIQKIEENVDIVNSHMITIADNSTAQSQDLVEVNDVIKQLDSMTQQNAAMAEETNAATQNLADLASELTQLISIFQVEENAAANKEQYKKAS